MTVAETTIAAVCEVAAAEAMTVREDVTTTEKTTTAARVAVTAVVATTVEMDAVVNVEMAAVNLLVCSYPWYLRGRSLRVSFNCADLLLALRYHVQSSLSPFQCPSEITLWIHLLLVFVSQIFLHAVSWLHSSATTSLVIHIHD